MAREPRIERERAPLEGQVNNLEGLSNRLRSIVRSISPDSQSERKVTINIGGISFFLETVRKGSVSMPWLVKRGDPTVRIRALSSPEKMEEFIAQISKNPFPIEIIVASKVSGEQVSGQAGPANREVSVPHQVRESRSQSLSFNALRRSVFRLFDSRLREQRLPFAVEMNGEIQGFITIHKRGGRYFIVDEQLGGECLLAATPESQTSLLDFFRHHFRDIDVRACVFRSATPEDKDTFEAIEREDMEEESAGLPAETTEVPSSEVEARDGDMSASGPSATVPRDETKSKTKRVRPLNRPKKRTKNEIKEREKRKMREEYALIMKAVLAFADETVGNGIKPETLLLIVRTLQVLGMMSGDQKYWLRRDLAADHTFTKLRALLLYFRDEERFRVKKYPLRMRGINTNQVVDPSAVAKVTKLAQEVYPKIEATAAHSGQTQALFFQNDERGLGAYATQLFGVDPLTLVMSISVVEKEESWLDIGSGQTPGNPNSLFNNVPLINPKVKMFGVDSCYDTSTATDADKVAGRVGKDFAGEKSALLEAGIAQNLPVADRSINLATASFVFDKFNDEPGVDGTQQALREAARVLVDGGELYVAPFDTNILDSAMPIIHKYFEFNPTEDSSELDLSYDPFYQGRKMVRVALRKKQLSDAETDILKKESDEWLAAHGYKRATVSLPR